MSPAPSPAELNQLIALFNAGRHADMETQARALTGRYPDSGFAWKLLGASLQIQGKNALPAFSKAVDLLPGDAEAHYNLGIVLKNLGQLDSAVASYRRALKLKPDYVQAHSNLGNALKSLGRLDDAVASYRHALKLKPDSADAHNNLGIALKELGQLDDAVASYHRALAINPNFASASYNLGNALQALGQLHDAAACYRRTLEIRPDFIDAYSNLGNALKDLGQFENALAIYRRVLELRPGSAEACNNLATTLKLLGHLDEALAHYRRAVEIKPDFAEAYSNMGDVFVDRGEYAAAQENYRRAIELNPDFAEAHLNLGNALNELGRLDDGVACYRRALQIQPDYTEAQGNLLFALNYGARKSAASCLEEARLYGRMVTDKATGRFSAWQCKTEPGILRVGLVSGDLRDHPVGYFLENLLAELDPQRIELVAYPTDYQSDALTARIKPRFAAWRPLLGLSDAAAASLIHADAVNVLLDLSGHTKHNRLPVFAWRPAPVQASWLGYFATTGVAEMDYLLADQTGVPESQFGQFTETVWHLPDTRLCFTPPTGAPDVAPLPALKNGHFTFGCFQRLTKVSDEALTLWGKILRALPASRLRWQCKQLGNPALAAQLLQRLHSHGIDPARTDLHGAVSRQAYLEAHAEVDVILDTFPHPGGTTTCEALWMGVPTLTLAGDTLLTRQGASLLAAAGLPDWVAWNETEYLDKAVSLTRKLPVLASLRAGLRAQAGASPLFDAPRFARNLEEALWGMWQTKIGTGKQDG